MHTENNKASIYMKKLLEYHLVSTSQGSYYIDDQLMQLWLKE